jgi:hypothetical protein
MTQSLEDLKTMVKVEIDLSLQDGTLTPEKIDTFIEQVYHARTEEVVKGLLAARYGFPQRITEEDIQHAIENNDYSKLLATLTPKISNEAETALARVGGLNDSKIVKTPVVRGKGGVSPDSKISNDS